MSEHISIHVEYYALDDESVSDNKACAEATYTIAEIAAMPDGALEGVVRTLITMTGAKLESALVE